MGMRENLKDLVAICTPIGGFIFAALGLSTWKKQLWGENRFTLMTVAIRELYLLERQIGDFRHNYYTPDEMYTAVLESKGTDKEKQFTHSDGVRLAEIRRWNAVVQQYQKFDDAIVKLKVLIDDFGFDVIGDDTAGKIVKEIDVKRMLNQFHEEESKNFQLFNEEQQQDYIKQQKDFASVLYRQGGDDAFERRVHEYFLAFKKKGRKYLRK